LIHAGGSGVGSAGVQIARLLGATVIATAGGTKKCRHAEELGAHIAIDHTAVDWVEEVRLATGGRGCHVVFEHVGASTFAGSVQSLARGGRLVTCGATTGGQVELSLHQVFFKNLSIIGNTMGSKGDLCRVLELFRAGRLRPVVDTVMPLDQLAEAHRRLEARDVFGKLVVEP
jgi:NADPH:quinone reductase-like Zn-dependent oxidoreductase